jgi:hypothetical protein
MLSNLTQVLDNSITTSNFTQTQIDTYKSNISLKQTSIISSESSLI